jgi:hypothetical protein
MEILNYFLVSLIVFAGLFCGWLVGIIAKEELKPGKKYLALLEKFLFSAVFLIAIIFVVNNMWLSIIFVGALVYLLGTDGPIKEIIIYVLFGITLYLSVERLFLLQAALMFVYGFPAGSLEKGIKDIIIKYVWFIPIAVLLFLVI